MTRRRELVPALLAAAALGVGAGCGGSDSAGSDGGSNGSSTNGGATSAGTEPVEGQFEGIDLALSIGEVKDLSLDGDLDVRGFVVSMEGTTLLCTTAVGSQPTCGQPSLVLVDYDGEVPSPEETVVTGEVSGNRLVVGG